MSKKEERKEERKMLKIVAYLSKSHALRSDQKVSLTAVSKQGFADVTFSAGVNTYTVNKVRNFPRTGTGLYRGFRLSLDFYLLDVFGN